MHKARAVFFACAGLFGLALLLPRSTSAAWPTNPIVNVPVCVAMDDQEYPAITSDGAGGAIVAWWDTRGGSCGIYAQRISVDGTPQWAADGAVLSTAAGMRGFPKIVSDGAGGALVTWRANSVAGIYAQRISADGTPQWPANGVALCGATDTTSGHQADPAITSDGAGGAIVVWHDYRGSGNWDIYAQRISAAGTVQWATNGVALCAGSGVWGFPTVVSDGAGGAIVTWADQRNNNFDIYAQWISAAGTVQWMASGVALCTAAGSQFAPTVVSDGAGGAIVTWDDYRSGSWDVYAQRISVGGTPQWTADGVVLCTAVGQYNSAIVSDGAGGAIITWHAGGMGGIYAQRISVGGTAQWTTNGVALCTAVGNRFGPTIISDGASGAIVTWAEAGGSGADLYADLYAQRISADGTVQWTADGVPVSTAPLYKLSAVIVSDGAGGAIVAWADARHDYNWDIYAQAVKANGELGSVLSVPSDAVISLALDPVRPNPTRGGTLTVGFTLASERVASLELLDVAGRRIDSREVGSLGAGRHTLNLGDGRLLAPGLYLVCLRQGTDRRVTRLAVLR
jgi:hypothetical protein